MSLVDDAEIVEPPHAVGASQPEDLDAPFEVVLRGAAPAPGALLLGRGEISLATPTP